MKGPLPPPGSLIRHAWTGVKTVIMIIDEDRWIEWAASPSCPSGCVQRSAALHWSMWKPEHAELIHSEEKK